VIPTYRLRFVVSNMSEPPIGQIYELWLIRSGNVPPQLLRVRASRKS
jgi:hypothetical protein